MDKVVVFGNTELALITHFYLSHDSPYTVAAYTVDGAYIKEDSISGLPVVPFEEVETVYPPVDYKMAILLSFRDVNKFRAEKYFQARAKGYQLINYISSRASVWPGLVIGDNCFISENSVVQPFVKIGSDVIVGPGSIVGHDSIISDHCFLASGTVILGRVIVEPYCFLGANSTIKDDITIARECIISAGALITKDTKERGVYIAKPAELAPKPSNELSTWLRWGVKNR
jgi:sugar O-acyltransferase (sialic acid O-acetyltransferase NeuD family)